MVELQEIFNVRYGSNLELNKLKKSANGVNFVSRTLKNNGVSSRVEKLKNVEPIPAGTLTVAGGGSVLETFLQSEPFYSGRDLYYLTAIIELSDAQKLFYCACIRSNKYKYSYGRQANRTLKYLQVPSIKELPNWLQSVDLSYFDGSERPQIKQEISPPIIVNSAKLSDIFEIKNGIAATGLNIKQNRFSECVTYIRPAKTNMRIVRGFLERIVIDKKHIHPKDSLFVSTNGEGSHSYSYVSIEDFVPNSDVSVLKPKHAMSIELKLYYAKCITQNRYLFSYGRKPKGKRLSTLMLPQPTKLEIKRIEEFVRSLNYSINI